MTKDINFVDELQATYTIEEIHNISSAFLDMLKTIRSEQSHYKDVIQRCTSAYNDVYHYCEFNDIKNATDKTMITRLLSQIGAVRRQAKDLDYLIDSLTVMENKEYSNLANKIHELQKRYKTTFEHNRKYQPRVLLELFTPTGENNGNKPTNQS